MKSYTYVQTLWKLKIFFFFKQAPFGVFPWLDPHSSSSQTPYCAHACLITKLDSNVFWVRHLSLWPQWARATGKPTSAGADKAPGQYLVMGWFHAGSHNGGLVSAGILLSLLEIGKSCTHKHPMMFPKLWGWFITNSWGILFNLIMETLLWYQHGFEVHRMTYVLLIVGILGVITS